MLNPTDEEIAGKLIDIISDGLNRSLSALRRAGAVDTTEMDRQYKGVGSKYYDLVTEQIELTARSGALGIRNLFEGKQTDGS